ncbi:MAG TPA: hypothetical protein VHC63_12120 [Acidimicrobiales bacterium]|nr:hypothetical protein [Acidimicrobiales bacterium]
MTGVGALIRFTIRRDRVRIVVWIASTVLLVMVTVASVKGLFPTQDALNNAVPTERSAAAIIFNGPAQGLTTVGGQAAYQTGTFGLIVMGLMSVFMVGRLTRGEEQAGRSELLRSLPIGPHALDAAAVVTVAGMNVVTGALVAAVLMAQRLPVAGSIVFGLSFALFGLLLSAFTLAASQVSENVRTTYGLGGVLLGAAWVLRGIGDVGSGAVSWLSPIGWAQKTRPFAGEKWWPFLVLVISTALLARVSVSVSGRRDVGAGLVAPRPGKAAASPSLCTPLGLAARLQRASFVGWSLGLALLAVAYGTVTSAISDYVKQNKAMADLVVAGGHGSIVEQYVAMSFRILALVAAGFAIQSALRMRSEETSMHAEALLATPLSRTRWAASHLAMAFGGSLLISVAMGVVFGVADLAVTGDTAAIAHCLVASLAFVPAVWVLVGITAFLVGVAPRATAAAWGALAACFVIGFFGQLLKLSNAVQDLSPFQHVPAYPATALSPGPLLALAAIASALTLAGLASLGRRDVG